MTYFKNLEKAYMDDQFKHANVVYDNEKGIGNIPLNRYNNASYRGWVCYMQPCVFLALTPGFTARDSLAFLIEAIKQKQAIATPFLRIDKDKNQIDDHEGRHRMTAIKEVYGDVEVPVQMSFNRIRARDLTLDDIRRVRSGVRKQNSRTMIKGPLFGNKIDFQGEWVSL